MTHLVNIGGAQPNQVPTPASLPIPPFSWAQLNLLLGGVFGKVGHLLDTNSSYGWQSRTGAGQLKG